jgi:hypothetical protein
MGLQRVGMLNSISQSKCMRGQSMLTLCSLELQPHFESEGWNAVTTMAPILMGSLQTHIYSFGSLAAGVIHTNMNNRLPEGAARYHT